MIVELSNAKVTLKDSLTWGDSEKIQAVILSGAKMGGKVQSAQDMGFDFDSNALLEAKYVALECAIQKIEEGEKELSFSREWVNNLSIEDGNKLYEAVDSLQKKGKGTTTA